MDTHWLKAIAFWRDSRFGRNGAIGAVLIVGENSLQRRVPVYLCSGEKWDLGNSTDSLRKGWRTNGKIRYKIFHPTVKSFYIDIPEADLVEDGMRFDNKRSLVLPDIINKKIFGGNWSDTLAKRGTVFAGYGIQHLETGNIINICANMDEMEEKIDEMFKKRRKLKQGLDFKTFEREFHVHYKVMEVQYRPMKVKL